MYDDYKVVYESNINEYLILWIVLGIILLILLLIVLVSISKVLKKANRSPLTGFIPIYNLIPLLEITNMSKSLFVPLIIPIVNIPFLLMLDLELAKLFKKDKKFGILLLVLPFIFFPILAFGKSEYIGINLVAMSGKNTIKDIPIIDDEKNEQIEKEINDAIDVSTNTSSISLGGGKYQKNYKNSLLSVEESMIAKGEVKKTPVPEVVTDGRFLNSNVKNQNINNQVVNTNNNLFNVSFINEQPESNNNIPNTTDNQIQQPVISETEQQVINSLQQTQSQVMPTQKFIPNPIIPQENNEPVKSNNEPRPRSCPNCGTRLADNATMCIICGQKI